MTPSKAFQCPLSFQISLKQRPCKHASFGTSCKLVGREWVWQLAAVDTILGLQADYVHHNLVGKRAILRTGSLCGGGVFPSSAAFYCLSSVFAFIGTHFRCYCWRTNIQPLRSYKHTFVLFCISMCQTHWNIALKIHPSPNKPWFNWNSPEIASTSQCWNANLQDSMSRRTWKFWRDQTCLNDWCAVASRWIYWILRAGTSFPKNVIKTAILEFQYCKLTFPKLTILPEIRGLGKQPSFWKQHFPDSYGFIAGDIEILRFGMSSISGIHWAFVAEVFSKFLMRDVGESPASLIHSCHLFDGSFNHF